MKKRYFVVFSLCLLAVWCGLNFFKADARQNAIVQSPEIVSTSPNFVVSDFQTAGDSSVPANDEFIEIHNTN